MARQGQSEVADANVGTPVTTPPVAGPPPVETTPPESGDNPPDPGVPEGTAQQGAATLGKTPPAGSGEEKPDVVAPPIPPAPPVKEGKKRVNCEALKGQKVIVGNGKVVQIDENGFFEVSEAEAERLLMIPGYNLA